MKKTIIWMPSFPKNIYVPIFEYVGKKNKDFNLIMCSAKIDNVPLIKYFKVFFFEETNLSILFFWPQRLLNLFKKQKIDLTYSIRYKKFSAEMDRLKPDLIISNLEYEFYTWQAAYYCKKSKIPFILQTETQRFSSIFHKIYFYLSLFFMKNLLFNQPKFIMTWTSDGLKFAKEYFKVNTQNIVMIPPPINTKLFYKIDINKNKNVFKLLMISRFVKYKRYEDVFMALKYIKDNSDLKVNLNIIGSGPLEKHIHKKINELQLNELIEFLPITPYDKLKSIYSNQDIFILPSFNEAIGMVVPEAMSCGIPAIVSDTCGAKTYIKEGINGLIFKTFDYKDLANKILFLCNRKRLEKFKKNAEKHIKTNYDIKKIGEKFDKLIKCALK